MVVFFINLYQNLCENDKNEITENDENSFLSARNL